MKFFDYIFYRSYKYYKRHDDLPMFTSVIIVGSEILALSSFAWIGLLDILFPHLPKHVYLITLIIALLVYLRYRNRVDSLKETFKDSKYNKEIPDWMCIWGTLFLSIIIGIFLGACMDVYINNHNLSGILWPYIEPYIGKYFY